MNFVIVGCGKAGFLHFSSYYKLSKTGLLNLDDIYFIDKRAKCSDLLSNLIQKIGIFIQVYSDIKTLVSKVNIDPKNTIIDLCLPSGCFVEIIQQFYKLNFFNYIIEKPFILPNDDQEISHIIQHIKIIKVENYLHSKIHNKMKYLIERYQLKVSLVITNFSKNRIIDSAHYRGFKDDYIPPSVFEIEIPHQVYICNDLFGEMSEIVYVQSQDMILEKKVFKNHGQGLLIGINNNNKLYIHYSNLCANGVERCIDVLFEKGYHLHANYASICEDRAGIPASLILRNENGIIEKHIFDSDDNMLAMLSYAIECFQKDNSEDFASWNSISSFSNLMNKVIFFEPNATSTK